MTAHVDLFELAVMSCAQVLTHLDGHVFWQDRQQQLLLYRCTHNMESINLLFFLFFFLLVTVSVTSHHLLSRLVFDRQPHLERLTGVQEGSSLSDISYQVSDQTETYRSQ